MVLRRTFSRLVLNTSKICAACRALPIRLATSWLIAGLALSVGSGAQAERADRDAKMVAEADFVRHDELKQTTNLKGNVTISKGTIRMRAAVVDFKYDQEGYQQAFATADPGKRVFFRQKREGLDEFIEAESELMEYNQRADTVHFTRNAVLRRYRGATLQDEVTGESIRYDNRTESFAVDNLPAVAAGAASSAPVPSGRVRVVLTPRASASGPGVSIAPAPAPQASAPLRASSSLGPSR
jgi:lipopolysaccharide export system protein LptA